jgi:hypothetical protein
MEYTRCNKIIMANYPYEIIIDSSNPYNFLIGTLQNERVRFYRGRVVDSKLEIDVTYNMSCKYENIFGLKFEGKLIFIDVF